MYMSEQNLGSKLKFNGVIVNMVGWDDESVFHFFKTLWWSWYFTGRQLLYGIYFSRSDRISTVQGNVCVTGVDPSGLVSRFLSS